MRSHDPNRSPDRIPNRTPTNERTNGLTEKSDTSANHLTSVTRAGGAEAFDDNVANLDDHRARRTTAASYWAAQIRADLQRRQALRAVRPDTEEHHHD